MIYRSVGRVSENTKLAQRIVSTPDDQPVALYGKTHTPRKVDGRWAVTLTFIETRGEGDNPFHADCLRFMQKLRDAPERELRHSVALKRMKMDSQMFQKLVQTLVEQGDVDVLPIKTSGRTAFLYRLHSA